MGKKNVSTRLSVHNLPNQDIFSIPFIQFIELKSGTLKEETCKNYLTLETEKTQQSKNPSYNVIRILYSAI